MLTDATAALPLVALAFVALAVTSTALQVSDAPAKKLVSPGLTAFAALAVLFGTLRESVDAVQGTTAGIALLLLAASDFAFERSGERPALFPVAMGLGVVSGFALGILFNAAVLGELSLAVHLGCAAVAALATAGVYRFLQAGPEARIALYVYLIQAVVLLTGGLACALALLGHFAAWGVLVFLSDSLVGIWAFPHPQRPIRWLTPPRLLIAILALYYPAQYALIRWAVPAP